MNKSPAFQFYPKDWLSSRNTLLMSPAYEGAYIRLLCYCWDSGDVSLPDDDEQLAVMSRLGEGWFKGGSTMVRKCFIPHPHKQGFLTNQKLLEEAIKQAAWKAKSSEGGLRSTAKRAENKAVSKCGSKLVEPKVNRPVQPKGNSATASSTANIDSVAKATSSPPTPKQTKVSVEDLTVDHIRDWLSEKRSQGRYLMHDEHFVLDQFKNYCQSKGKQYADYIAGYRNAFEWERCQPKNAGGQPNKEDRAKAAVARGLEAYRAGLVGSAAGANSPS